VESVPAIIVDSGRAHISEQASSLSEQGLEIIGDLDDKRGLFIYFKCWNESAKITIDCEIVDWSFFKEWFFAKTLQMLWRTVIQQRPAST
jgi:hypothetical protein